MALLIADPRPKFIELINLSISKVQFEPHIMFICGGPVDVKTTNNHSIRNMFMNLSGGAEDKSKGFVLAENFKDWKEGYRNLSEFENDIAYLSSLVVIFLESEGALTEFGLFFANIEIRKKLVIVIHDEFHKSESFIKFGLLNPLEDENQRSVRVYTIDHRNIESVDKAEVGDILQDILDFCDEKNKTEQFNVNHRGHHIFLVFQLVDLFLSLTKSEIGNYLKTLGIILSNAELKSALYVLEKFNLINIEKKSSQYFYYVPSGLGDRINLHLAPAGRRYDTISVKIEVSEYYNKAAETNPSHKRRLKVIKTSASGGS